MSDVRVMKVLMAHVEISDQYGTSKANVVGVFFDEESIEQAKQLFSSRVYRSRIAYEIIDCLPNKIYLPK